MTDRYQSLAHNPIGKFVVKNLGPQMSRLPGLTGACGAPFMPMPYKERFFEDFSPGEVTEFGKLADPIADKALMGAALIGLSILGDLPWWVTAVILVREIGVTVLRFAVLRHGVIPASRGGKLKTLVQAVAIGLFILPLSGPWHTGAWVVMWIAIALTVITGIDYVISAIRKPGPAGH